MEKIGNKNIYHNYGHSGAGVTFAPCTAEEVGELVSFHVPRGEKIALLGSGIVGLTSALHLQERGYKVKVYSKVIPKKNEQDPMKLIASQVAPGIWFPNEEENEQRKRNEVSIRLYNQWAKKYKSIGEFTYYREETLEEFNKIIP